VLAFGQREKEREQRHREEGGARHVEPGRRLDRRLRHEEVDEHNRDRHTRRPHYEEPAPAEVVDDHAGEREAEPAADAEDGRDGADRRPHLLRRELVLDDREGEREDRGAAALEDAKADQHADVPGDDRPEAAGEEDAEADQEHSLLAVLVAELAEERRRH
jgi:hypothetical protein